MGKMWLWEPKTHTRKLTKKENCVGVYYNDVSVTG
jgi:hypothetical protein